MFASRFDEFSLSGLRFRRQILTVLSSEQEAICRESDGYYKTILNFNDLMIHQILLFHVLTLVKSVGHQATDVTS